LLWLFAVPSWLLFDIFAFVGFVVVAVLVCLPTVGHFVGVQFVAVFVSLALDAKPMYHIVTLANTFNVCVSAVEFSTHCRREQYHWLTTLGAFWCFQFGAASRAPWYFKRFMSYGKNTRACGFFHF
jgi:hypothetical protein